MSYEEPPGPGRRRRGRRARPPRRRHEALPVRGRTHGPREGMRRLRMDRALARYLNLEFTLSRATQYARVTIHAMARVASEKGIPFFRYSLDELRRDRERAEAWLKG